LPKIQDFGKLIFLDSMMNFCTLFDSYYMYKGIAMYLSLESVTNDFHLYVMAFDNDCFRKLTSLNFKHMTVVCWEDFENGKILEIKEERTRAEYCWSCGPSVIFYFLTHYKLPNITYLDSDLYFVGNPQIAYDEIGEKSIAITEQGIDEKSAELYGKYCVQFIYFKNNELGIEALTWWRDSCLDWCYQRFEDGKYADQKYLDQFPLKFKDVHVMKNPGVGIAPWNMYRYTYNKDNTLSYNGDTFLCVFFHMHGLICDLKGDNLVLRSFDFPLTQAIKDIFFNDYANLVKVVFNTCFLKKINTSIVIGQSWVRQIEYNVRIYLKNFKLVQFIYFKLRKKEYKGHGTKL
jgi:hypothetical protein